MSAWFRHRGRSGGVRRAPRLTFYLVALVFSWSCDRGSRAREGTGLAASSRVAGVAEGRAWGVCRGDREERGACGGWPRSLSETQTLRLVSQLRFGTWNSVT